ncbi:SIMPL domain-containing protein [Ferruginibacter sp. SUN106]|uniref:SIMPL domain-containing protein n=1 Tax=Ferruginibacter sp. SUN106 TaxID=2978348 RepID=UPI003D35FB16
MSNMISFRIAIILATAALFSNSTFSQNKKSAEITAEGSSKIKVRPDMVTFTLTIEKTDTIEKNVIKILNEEVESLSRSLEKLGFQNKAVKVSDYRISSSFDDDRRQKTYTASNVLKVEFWLDNKLIDAFYNEIQGNNFKDLDINYETGISDSLEKSTRVLLVQSAIENAQANAANISKKLGLTIIKVKQVYKENVRTQVFANEISYVRFTPAKIVGDTDISYKTSFDKFQVEETELEEKITVVYEVSN